MTTQLTNLLANIIQPQSGSNAQPKEVLNTLSQATQLETAAKVTITRLPEQILSIQMQGQKSLRVALPPELSALQINRPQVASITQGSQPQGVLFSTAIKSQNININSQQIASLTQSLSMFIAASEQADQALTVNGTNPQLKNNVLTLSLSTGQSLTLVLSKNNAQALAPLLTQNSKNIALSLTPNTQAGINVNLLSSAQDRSYIQGPTLSPSDSNLLSIVSSALRTQGVALRHYTELPNAINQLLPKMNTSNGVQHASLFKLQGNSLATHSAINQAIIKFPLTDASASLPALSNKLGQKLTLSSIPDASLAATTSNINSAKQTHPNQAPDNLQSLKGSDIHRTIIALSRTLLSQTGSTQKALSQLIALLDSHGVSQNSVRGDGQNNVNDATRGILKQVSAQLSSLHSNVPETKAHSINTNAVKLNDEKGSAASLSLTDIEPDQMIQTGKESLSNKSNATPSDMTMPARIQALLAAPAMAATPLALTSPASASSFVQGLVVLLQLSLAGKALMRQPTLKQLIDMPDSIVSKTLASSGVSGASSRIVQDMANLDNRSQLLSNLKTLLANHQYNKFAQVENRIQGQDSLYYVLPALSNSSAPPELLIQRDPEHNQSKATPSQKRNIWNITMKLDIGEVGQILAKSKIDGDTLSIDLYTSNEILLHRVADTLPFLKRRITDLGLHIDNMSYQRGHIPTSLNARPHQIFETKV